MCLYGFRAIKSELGRVSTIMKSGMEVEEDYTVFNDPPPPSIPDKATK